MAEKQEYTFLVREYIDRVFTVEATSEDEAEKLVKEEYCKKYNYYDLDEPDDMQTACETIRQLLEIKED